MKDIKKPPVEKNSEYDIEIESVTSEGMGAGHIDGFCVFVKAAAPGDILRILIVKVKSSYAYGIIKKIITPSKIRTEAVCPEFSKCGGCSLMHIKYEEQLNIKKQIIDGAFLRIGGLDFKTEGVIEADPCLRYRNKMIFPVGRDKNGNAVCGFYRERSHDIVPLCDCFLGDAINRDIINTVMEHIKRYNISVYDENTHTGAIRRIFTRKGYKTGEVMAVISVNEEKIPALDELVLNISKISENIKSIIVNINDKKTNAVLGDKNKVLFGKGTIEDELCGLRFEISPESFYQVNPTGTQKLYGKVMEFAEIGQDENVLDIYCGIGTISLLASKRAKSVMGIEIVPDAVENANKNAERNNIKNVRFFAADAGEKVEELVKDGLSPDVVILDPPRKGADQKTLSAIANVMPERIVYVSCDPATLARDLRFLTDNGFELKKAVGVDMFAQTAHVETVVLLSQRKSDE